MNRRSGRAQRGKARLDNAAVEMSALPPKAEMCGATRDVCFGPKADIRPTSNERSNARQGNPDLGELVRRCIDLLFDDDVVADGKAKPGTSVGGA